MKGWLVKIQNPVDIAIANEATMLEHNCTITIAHHRLKIMR